MKRNISFFETDITLITNLAYEQCKKRKLKLNFTVNINAKILNTGKSKSRYLRKQNKKARSVRVNHRNERNVSLSEKIFLIVTQEIRRQNHINI